jgi:hypothetical protein
MPTPGSIAESFRQLDFHDDTLVDLYVLPAQRPWEGSVVKIQLRRGSATSVLQFSGCANLRVAMDFDVLAGNLLPNTSRVDAHAEAALMRSLMQSQEKDWDVKYAGTSTSPLTKKLAKLDELVFFRVQFFGGAVEVIGREYQQKPAKEPIQRTPR